MHGEEKDLDYLLTQQDYKRDYPFVLIWMRDVPIN